MDGTSPNASRTWDSPSRSPHGDTTDVASGLPTDALPVECDVTDESSDTAAIDTTLDEFSALDVLGNNAGTAGTTAPVEDVAALLVIPALLYGALYATVGRLARGLHALRNRR